MSNDSIELENVGPIEHLSIPIPEGGGIVCLKGSNGSGKSHALAGVEALYSSSARKTLRNSDGVPSGKIEGLGVTIRLGRSNTAKGELVCESLDGRCDPSQLVDPGLKDPVAADARRLATLVRLAGIKVSLDQWNQLFGHVSEELELRSFVDGDPVATADRLRRRIHDVALNRERLADSTLTVANALEKTVVDVPVDVEHDATRLADQLDRATQQLAKAQQQRKFAYEALNNANESQRMLDSHLEQAIDVGLAEFRVDEIKKACTALKHELEAAQQVMRELETRLLHSDSDLKKAERELQVAKQSKVQIDAWQQTIDKASLVELPSDEWISELTEAKNVAFQSVQQGEVVRRAIASRTKAQAIKAEAEQLAKLAERLRGLARSTDTVLEQALVDAGFDTIKVHDGRLCVESERGLEPVSELSHGERWRMALDLAARGLPKGSVLPVAQEAFESLDPDNREFINRLAKERGLVIVTAEASGGELRAEVWE